MSVILHEQRVLITVYFDVASACILSYDYLLTFSSEMSLIWNGYGNWTLFQVLFVLSRYMPFADAVIVLYGHFGSNTTDTSCQRLNVALGWMFTVGQVLTETTFLMRTWAMWGATRRVGALLVAFFLASWIPCIILEGIILKLFVATRPKSGPLLGCVKRGNATLVRIQDATILLYWSVLLVLMMLKGGSPRKRLSSTGFYGLLYRDGITYCGILCCVVTANMIATAVAPEYLKLLIFFQHVILSVLTNRILFRLRQYNQRTSSHADIDALSALVPEGAMAFGRQENINLVDLQPRHSDDTEDEPQEGLGAV
ncbi:hypothetical protein FIBSPDRAFT_1037117 [Athelia psychrophila]|uniref:DUF6533 domain-containing protein n=1 Tax=Athelia psychrophila TaxID=1759441 RepID=A0A166UT28_9AGAM|nr:hypothetical protein FIBSPDRAFT_1037117 [Fibularhizoctonia sp. CBS 109695]